ncbi:hypothetical protein COE50_14575 [Bacillus anthracis]|uniref:phage holin n=1 Tax=Bacillus tropicus TaxID=2026188 RepID=UPI000BF3CCEE|nr:hypothetical protein COK10_13840 [Bacillus anthracis]PGZ31893.1 hypothetical protein COE50_14575 [Bacillus anthracis]
MLQKENLSDIIRLLAGFLLSLKLLFNSFGVNFISNDQIDAIVNVVSFLFILYFGFELPPLNTLTSCLKWGIPTNTKVSPSFMSRQSP